MTIRKKALKNHLLLVRLSPIPITFIAATMSSKPQIQATNIIDFFTGKNISELAQERFIRLAPENDGFCMLYSKYDQGEHLLSVPILCWALRWNGEAVGLVPWLDGLYACTDIYDEVHGEFEAYYDAEVGQALTEVPQHKIIELETAAAYFEAHSEQSKAILQEIPDTIGTHALLVDEEKQSITLTEVISWRLMANGQLQGMLIDQNKISDTPVLAGDPCLYPAHENPNFYYYFHHQIANKIKNKDPETLESINRLLHDL